MDKIENKSYKTKIRQDYHVKTGYFYYIELHNELIEELGWYEDLKVDVTVKLGEDGNVMVITRA